MRLSCKLGFHQNVVFHREGDRGCLTFEPFIWESAYCHNCNQKLAPTKKMLKRKTELDTEIAKIRKECELYGRPRIEGTTSL